MEPAAAVFKALGEPTRLRLVVLLAIRGETCVCELAQALGVPQCKISRHLAVLRSAGLVDCRRDGTWMYYKLSATRNRLDAYLQECFQKCLADHPVVVKDQERLAEAVSDKKLRC